MARPIRKNDNFIFKHQLAGSETDQFIRARVWDSTFTEVAGSPFTLTHLANGLYRNNSIQATVIGNYTVQYTVYRDAGFTQLNSKYGRVEEDIFVFDYDQLILAAVNLRPTNPLLTNDSRLDNLPLIPDKLDASAYDSGKTEIINTLSNKTDDSDGRAV